MIGVTLCAMAGCGKGTPGKDMTVTMDLSTGGGDLSTGADLSAGSSTVTVGPGGSFTFSPQTLTIKAGSSVTWTWDTGGHDVVSGSPGTPDNKFCSPQDKTPCDSTNSPVSPGGTTYTHRFDTAGTFPYFCRPHSGAGMTGTIIVQ